MGTQRIKKNLLIIDDDMTFCHAISDYFRSDAIEIISVHTGKDGMDICSQKEVDVILLDQKLPDAEGHTLCQSILKYNDRTKIIFITAYPSFDNALRAIKSGAFDYLSKPFELGELDHAIRQSLRTMDLEKVEQLEKYKDGREIEDAVLIGNSKGFDKVKELVKLSASVEAPVLITGETGTGKNIVAKSIHYNNNTMSKIAFININCAALPENLIEAELFGYEKGAFTGATTTKKGVFEMAEGGTLFLDEIGEMPFQLQSKLLSVLDEKKIKRLGGDTFRSVDVRIIAATNTNISNAINEKRFREDLFYRLSVIRIHLPPLRDRKEDITALCGYFIKKLDNSRGLNIHPSEVSKLLEYDWPGNVRELRNIIERAILVRHGNAIKPSDLLKDPSDIRNSPMRSTLEADNNLEPIKDVEKNYIKYALEKLSSNYSKTSRVLGISLSTLKRKIKYYNLI